MEINCRGSNLECEFGDGATAERDFRGLDHICELASVFVVSCAETAGDALDENFGVGINKNGQGLI